MGQGMIRRKIALWSLGALTLLFFLPAVLPAQEGTVGSSLVDPGEEGKRQALAGTPKSRAPEDLTGYWVALVTEDWLYRMITPAKGDYESVPLTAEGVKMADSWDPAKDEATGNQCKAYGAAAIMRVPGRLHITWENDATLRIDTDAGTQTRLLHFDGQPAPAGAPQWQGYSTAEWQRFGGGRGVPLSGGFLKVETTHMRPGYLRKNGVPYSGNANLQEYFTRVAEPDGNSYLIVTSILNDQLYMNGSFTTSTHFKKLSDASGWRPTACKAR
jgi:hypothetical protein